MKRAKCEPRELNWWTEKSVETVRNLDDIKLMKSWGIIEGVGKVKRRMNQKNIGEKSVVAVEKSRVHAYFNDENDCRLREAGHGIRN